MAGVAPFAGPQLPLPIDVRWNRPSVVCSALMSLYIVFAPLDAYIYEPFPWTISPPAVATQTSQLSWAAASPLWLTAARASYNDTFFARGASYAYDRETNTDVYRSALNTSAKCELYELHTGALLSARLQSLVCTFVQNSSSPSGGCQENMMLSLRASVLCVWFTPMSDGASDDANDSYTVYEMFHLAPTPDYLYGMLAFRLTLTVYMALLCGRRYLQPVRRLHRHCYRLPARRCDVIVGDPTSLLVLDPLLTLAMALDLWLSVPVVGSSTIAVSQLQALDHAALGCMYLSRMAWFAYGSLVLVSKGLKRYHWEARYRPASPTVLAVFATLVTGPLTYLQAQSYLLVQLYEMIFAGSEPSTTQIVYGFLLFHLLLAALPLVYFLQVPPSDDGGATALFAKAVTTRYTTVGATDWKQRLLLPLFLRSAGYVRQHGCSLYNFFYIDASFRACPGLSQRGSDCYIVLYSAGNGAAVKRLALRRRVDLTSLPVTIERRDELFGSLGIVINKGATNPTYVVVEPTQAPCEWVE
ncbi:hypothetical protein SDRG_12069 [Saprolegnia diclina VS20]|uniref:Uncharacterized protein n=1 Tax=Saprolegnia diclina (strain VS20) TaxID=1156394 RepID=T0RD93_SAPDV|nr:hypothetical protein SDRG_12069 [Saprolegnia diclina VS20]EQC30218.1 hypothetical protein SDRG_12069 [Saprolegnia diclina VS20]|eukprot:XP_008616350.1 hypothetical protein SDRG_12069 [Saprolegnia diclina VS20]